MLFMLIPFYSFFNLTGLEFIFKIQRSFDLVEYEGIIEEFESWCEAKSPNLVIYFRKFWFCSEWESGWIDMERPGSRIGLWNTNNASESFFKTLLRSFLGGIGNRRPADLLRLVEDNVFAYYENKNIEFTTKRNFIGVVAPEFKNIQLHKDGELIRVTYKDKSSVVDCTKKACNCAFFLCKGKCIHLDVVVKWLLANCPQTVEPECRILKVTKAGPKKKQHLPSILLEDIQKRNVPGPIQKVLSQRTRTRLVTPPVRFRANITENN